MAAAASKHRIQLSAQANVEDQQLPSQTQSSLLPTSQRRVKAVHLWPNTDPFVHISWWYIQMPRPMRVVRKLKRNPPPPSKQAVEWLHIVQAWWRQSITTYIHSNIIEPRVGSNQLDGQYKVTVKKQWGIIDQKSLVQYILLRGKCCFPRHFKAAKQKKYDVIK